jgi:hypothetical protein
LLIRNHKTIRMNLFKYITSCFSIVGIIWVLALFSTDLTNNNIDYEMMSKSYDKYTAASTSSSTLSPTVTPTNNTIVIPSNITLPK